jgi:hypothetical protein
MRKRHGIELEPRKCPGCNTVSWVNKECKNQWCSRECESLSVGKSMPIRYRRDVFNPWHIRKIEEEKEIGDDEDDQ